MVCSGSGSGGGGGGGGGWSIKKLAPVALQSSG